MPRIPTVPITGSVYLDGTRRYTSGSNTGLDSNDAWTSSLWVLPQRASGALVFNIYTHFGASGGGGGTSWIAACIDSVSPGRLSARLGGISTIADAAPANKWIHFLTTYDGTTTTIYRDGVLKNSGAQAAALTNGVFRIGDDGSGAAFGKGFITMVRLWNRVLTAAEILSVYNGETPTSGLLIRYDMTDGTGNTITDSSGNANNATGAAVLWSTQVPSTGLRTAAAARTAI